MNGLMLALILGTAAAPIAGQAGKGVEMQHAAGTFEVKMKPEPLSEVAAKSGIQRMSMDKVYHGQLEATSQGEFLAVGGPERSGGYVAVERVTGTLDGKSGSFALQHSATMTEGKPAMNVTVIPGSGTGALQGIVGSLTILIDGGKHSYDFAYSF